MARPDGRHHRQIPGPQITLHNHRRPQPPPPGAPAPHTPTRRPASRPGAVFMSAGPPACMSLFVYPRFTLSLSGTHTLRSLLRSLRYVLPSEGVAVSVSRYCIARGKAHTGPGTHLPRGCAEAPYAALHELMLPAPACLSPGSRSRTPRHWIKAGAREKTSKRTIQHVSRSFWPMQAGLTETSVCLSDRMNRQPPLWRLR